MEQNVSILYVLLAIAGGAIIPFHAGTNATFSRSVHSPIWATLFSMGVSLAVVLVLLVVMKPQTPNTVTLQNVPWWSWISGAIAVVYVVFTMLMAPKLGAGTFMASVIAGQMICSILLDNYGLVGFKQHPINWTKLIGVLLVIVGAFIVSISNK
ncbi:DMT family transporter [Tenacibaculum amylolyticum]|uniref:DMT family transporter n=1 Tax=Tenacibaculum amylolyticum TaxID=104269 RepID=UPI0038948538